MELIIIIAIPVLIYIGFTHYTIFKLLQTRKKLQDEVYKKTMAINNLIEDIKQKVDKIAGFREKLSNYINTIKTLQEEKKEIKHKEKQDIREQIHPLQVRINNLERSRDKWKDKFQLLWETISRAKWGKKIIDSYLIAWKEQVIKFNQEKNAK